MLKRLGRLALAIGCAVAAATGAVRGSAAAPASSATVVRLVAREFAYEPKDIVVPVGEVTFAIENRGATEHNFVVEGPNRRKLAEIATILPGKAEDVSAILTPGAYGMVCTLPGHREAGMVGTLRVTPR